MGRVVIAAAVPVETLSDVAYGLSALGAAVLLAAAIYVTAKVVDWLMDRMGEKRW
jgi:hypothetical protein